MLPQTLRWMYLQTQSFLLCMCCNTVKKILLGYPQLLHFLPFPSTLNAPVVVINLLLAKQGKMLFPLQPGKMTPILSQDRIKKRDRLPLGPGLRRSKLFSQLCHRFIVCPGEFLILTAS